MAALKFTTCFWVSCKTKKKEEEEEEAEEEEEEGARDSVPSAVFFVLVP